jgi:hypothetical protein
LPLLSIARYSAACGLATLAEAVNWLGPSIVQDVIGGVGAGVITN